MRSPVGVAGISDWDGIVQSNEVEVPGLTKASSSNAPKSSDEDDLHQEEVLWR